MDELQHPDVRDLAELLYGQILAQLGVSGVSCTACARALLPAPFNWESYTYTISASQSWTWDVTFARAVVTRRVSRTGTHELDSAQLARFLERHGHILEDHLAHIPSALLDEPVLVAPLPDGRGHVLIDGSHRATRRVRTGQPVRGLILTPVESALAQDVVPTAMRRVYDALRRRGFIPPDLHG
jgi:hypothetical protein